MKNNADWRYFCYKLIFCFKYVKILRIKSLIRIRIIIKQIINMKMKKFILGASTLTAIFGLMFFAVPVLAQKNELNGSEIGGRKIVVNKAEKLIDENDIDSLRDGKAVKEVMDVYDKMEIKNLIADGTLECLISKVVKSQNGDDIVLRKRPGRTKFINLVLKQMTSSELLELCKSGSIILLGDDSQRDF